jgi:Tfp pilus assembly protein PilF
MFNLAFLEDHQGNLDQARHWYQQAITTGHSDFAPRAMFNLGILEDKQGNLDRARHYYQRAITTGHTDHAPRAMIELGHLEAEVGNLRQARHWSQRAIATGHTDFAPRAMEGRGRLEAKAGNLDQARHWWRQAITTGHTDHAPRAMFNLGLFEKRQGNLDQARHWWRQAAATGHCELATRAQQELDALDRSQDERQRGEEFGRYGYLAYADPALLTRADRPPTEPDPEQTVDRDKGTILRTALYAPEQRERSLLRGLRMHSVERVEWALRSHLHSSQLNQADLGAHPDSPNDTRQCNLSSLGARPHRLYDPVMGGGWLPTPPLLERPDRRISRTVFQPRRHRP